MLRKIHLHHPRTVPLVELDPISLLPQLIRILNPQSASPRQINANLPLRAIQPAHRQHLLNPRGAGSKDGGMLEPKRLARIGTEIDAENNSHGGCGWLRLMSTIRNPMKIF